VDARTDIFALGAILYEAATGRVAFHASSDYDTMKRIVEGTYEPPERVVGGLHPVIAGCIRKALAVDPAERFHDCAAFREALEKVLDENPSVAPKPSRSYAVTQVGNPPAAPAPESAFAPTYIPPRGRTSSDAGDTSAPAPSAPAPSALAPVPPASLQRLPAPTLSPAPNASPGLALTLSLLCLPGVGQIYNGQVFKGLVILGLSIVALANGGEWICLFFAGYVGLAIDAYRIAAKRQSGRQVSPWEFF
jgi:serine/threonine-protein kinase